MTSERKKNLHLFLLLQCIFFIEWGNLLKKKKKKRNTVKNNLPTKLQGHSVSAPLAVDQCVFVLAYCFFWLQPFYQLEGMRMGHKRHQVPPKLMLVHKNAK